jgi:hypothetical protein
VLLQRLHPRQSTTEDRIGESNSGASSEPRTAPREKKGRVACHSLGRSQPRPPASQREAAGKRPLRGRRVGGRGCPRQAPHRTDPALRWCGDGGTVAGQAGSAPVWWCTVVVNRRPRLVRSCAATPRFVPSGRRECGGGVVVCGGVGEVREGGRRGRGLCLACFAVAVAAVVARLANGNR